MKDKRNKILGVAVGFLAVVTIIAGVAYAVSINKSTPTETTNQAATNETPDLGACQLVSTAQIRAANLGDRIIGIREGVRASVDGLSGDAAEGCVFNFSTQKANNNVLTVSVYPYVSSQEGFSKESQSAQWSEMMGSTPASYFGRTTIDDGATTLYFYRIPTGGSTVLLTLRQATSTRTYDEPNAIDFLGTLGAKINLATVQEKAKAQAPIEAGRAPDAPPAGARNDILDVNDTEPSTN